MLQQIILISSIVFFLLFVENFIEFIGRRFKWWRRARRAKKLGIDIDFEVPDWTTGTWVSLEKEKEDREKTVENELL
jgi:hypothetical protein